MARHVRLALTAVLVVASLSAAALTWFVPHARVTLMRRAVAACASPSRCAEAADYLERKQRAEWLGWAATASFALAALGLGLGARRR